MLGEGTVGRGRRVWPEGLVLDCVVEEFACSTGCGELLDFFNRHEGVRFGLKAHRSGEWTSDGARLVGRLLLE